MGKLSDRPRLMARLCIHVHVYIFLFLHIELSIKFSMRFVTRDSQKISL